MTGRGPGFTVLYRWRLHPGKEQQFIEAWSRVSDLLLHNHASLGSRLHRGPDDIWYSYARWPSAEARDNAFAHGSVDSLASQQMQDAIVERLPEWVLEPVADYMVLPSSALPVGQHTQ